MAELVGVPRLLIPASVAELDRYVASVRPELRCTPAARESMAYLLDPPGLDQELAGFWPDVRDGAGRTEYGGRWSPATPSANPT